MSKFINFFILIIAFLFFLIIISSTWIFVPLNATEPTEKIINIPYDYNIIQIRKLLEKENIIRPTNFFFQLITRITKVDQKIQSGEYQFSSSQNLLQIIDQLVKGNVLLHRITIPEGYQVKQIAQLLDDNGIAEYKQVLKLVNEENEFREGYLFPDTYTFPKNYGALKTLKAMNEKFKNIIENNIEAEQGFPQDLNFHQIIVLSSIIEKEAQGKEDKPKIASVFYNRLNEGMRLQSCATIQYLLEKPKEVLTQKDLEIDSPFNTYLNKGLPPEPICNPGLDSILAAAYPAKEDYLYFVLGKNGEHIFSKTYQEHLENKP